MAKSYLSEDEVFGRSSSSKYVNEDGVSGRSSSSKYISEDEVFGKKKDDPKQQEASAPAPSSQFVDVAPIDYTEAATAMQGQRPAPAVTATSGSSGTPELRSYEPTLLQRVSELFGGTNRDRASNELAARRIAQEQGISVDEVYRQAGGSRPLFNPEGRAPVMATAEAANVLADEIPKIPAAAANTVLRTIRGGDIDATGNSTLDKLIAATDGEPSKNADPNYDAFSNLGKSFGYSLTTLVSSAVAFAGGNVVAGPPGGLIAATAASTGVSYRASKDEFLDRVKQKLDGDSKQIFGQPLSQEEWAKAREEFEGAAIKYGAWEAIPETVSNLIFLKPFAAPMKAVGTSKVKEFADRAVKAAATGYVPENITETMTALGQNAAEREAGLTTDNLTVGDAFKQQFIPTLLMTGGTAGGAAAVKKGTEVYETQVLPRIAPERAFANALETDIQATSPERIDAFIVSRQRAEQAQAALQSATSADEAVAAAEAAAGTVDELVADTESQLKATQALINPTQPVPLVSPAGEPGLPIGELPSLQPQPLPAAQALPALDTQALPSIDPQIEQQFGLDKLRLQPATETQTAAAPAPLNVPRPQRIQGTPVDQLTDDQLDQIVQDETIPAITRRGASVELTARRADNAQSTQANTRVEPALTTIPEPAPRADGRIEPTVTDSFLAINEPGVRDIPAAPVGGPVAAARARETAQQGVDAWSVRTGQPVPAVFNPAPPQLDAAVNEIAQAVNSQFAGRIYAYNDPRPESVNGLALGGVAFVNTANVDVNAARTSLHEFKHTVEQIARAETNQGLTGTAAQRFVAEIDSIYDDMTDAGKRTYLTNFLAKDELAAIADPAAREARLQELLADPNTRSEMTADFLGNRATDKKFWQDVAAADPEGFKGFVEKWIRIIDNLLAQLRGTKTQSRKESARVDKYVRDLNKAKMVAREALISYSRATRAQTAAPAQAVQTPVTETGTNVPEKGFATSARDNQLRRGTAEQIGEYSVRTQKDGSLAVLGDAAKIRELLPEGVQGRPVPGGIVFTTSAAPRVRAALEGRKVAYSRAGQVLGKLPMKGGTYIGAPAKFNTPTKIPKLRKWLRQLAEEGAPGRYWYENSGREVLKMVGGDVNEARKFVALLAIYSPQAKVDANSTFALRAWAQYKMGQPISVKTGSQDQKAKAAMDDVDAFWSGEKTGNFFFNLLREIDPSTEGKQGATIDMWMMRAGQYPNDAPTATQYAFMENETNRLAQELGWEPQQVQAAIWVAMKARMENAGVKKRTEESSEKNGWIRYDYPIKNGKPRKTRVILDEQKHRDNWLKYSFEHDPTKDDTAQAKFDFGDGLRRHIGQISFEARPGRTTGVLPGIHDAPYEQQLEFQQAVQAAFLDADGNDRLAQMLGLLVDSNDITVPGVWQGDVSPSQQKLVAMAPAKGDEGKANVDPDQAKALNLYAAMAGLVARQEGVGWHRPFYAGAKKDANGLDIKLERPIAPEEAVALEKAIGGWMAANDRVDWQDSFAIISSPTGVRLVSFGAASNSEMVSDIIGVAESVLPDGTVDWFASSGDMPTNKWKEYPNGEAYVERASAEGRPDVLEWVRDVLAPRVQRVFDDFSDKYGWGDPGRPLDIQVDGSPRQTQEVRAPASAPETSSPEVSQAKRQPQDIAREELAGRRVRIPVMIEETGQTGTVALDAKEALDDVDAREDTMQKLLECLSK